MKIANIRQLVLKNAKRLNISTKNLEIQRFENAYSNLVYKISSGKKNVVLKVFNDSLVDENKIAEKELALLQKFKGISPKVLFVDTLLGKPAIFEEFVAGSQLTGRRLSNEDVYQIAELLAKIHSAKIDVKIKNLLKRDYVKVPGENLENIIAWLKKVDNKNVFAPRIIKIYERIKNHYAANLKPKRAICHGDFKLLNIVKTHKGLKIFDWELALIGDPAWEVAVFFYFAEHKFDKTFFSKQQLNTLLKTYLKLRPDTELKNRMHLYYCFMPLQNLLWNVREYFAFNVLNEREIVSGAKEKLRKKIEKELAKLEVSLR